MRIYNFKNHFIVLILFVSLLSLLLAACSNEPAKPPTNNGSPTPTFNPAATICPPSGTARAAIMPSLHISGRPQLIYYTGDNSGTSFIRRINVANGATTNILGLANAHITEAQISPDGQWLLFT